jgi:hypothetical protein
VSSVAQYGFRGGSQPSTSIGVGAGSGGGDMDDVLRRLGSLEKDVSAIKTDVAGIVALLPHMATKADVMAIKADVMATKADIAGMMNLLPDMATKADVADSKTSIIQWMVGTMIAVAALAFTIAKFVH